MNKKFNVLCIGLAVMDAMAKPVSPSLFQADTTVVDEILMTLGGDAANEAVILSRLVGKTGLIGRLGDDINGRQLLDILQKQGVDTANMRMDPDTRTSISMVLITPEGDRSFLCFVDHNNDRFRKDDFDLSVVLDAKVLAYGGMYLMREFDKEAPEVFRYAHDNGVITIADCVHDAYGLGEAYAREMLPHLDYFVPSYVEAQAILGIDDVAEMTRKFRSFGCPNIIIKLGEEGVYINSPDFEGRVPSFEGVTVVDTTGAGDNFVAGFITGILDGKSIQDAARFGSAVSCVCIGAMGATSAVQSREQIDAFLAAHGG